MRPPSRTAHLRCATLVAALALPACNAVAGLSGLEATEPDDTGGAVVADGAAETLPDVTLDTASGDAADASPGDTSVETALDADSLDTKPDTGVISLDTGSLDTGVDTGTLDTGVVVDTGTPDTGVVVGDTGSPDTGVIVLDTSITPPDMGTDTSTCGALGASWTDAFVDKTSTMPSVGTKACPFLTIGEAANATGGASTRTLHVQGGSFAPLIYSEGKPVRILSGVTLVGEGTAVPKLVSTATDCLPALSSACAVYVSGGTVDRFTITTTTGSGIITDTSATLKNLFVDTCREHGIWMRGGGTLDNVKSTNNGLNGLWALAGGGLGGFVTVTNSAFSTNSGSGIVQNTTGLQLSSVTASGNAGDGLTLTLGKHNLTAVTASGNKRSGMSINAAAVNVGSGTFLANGQHGIWYVKSSLSSLNLGGGAIGSVALSGLSGKNGISGLCIDNSGGTDSEVASSLVMGACPPTQVEVGACAKAFTYAEIAYAPASPSSPNPVKISGCSVGP